MTDSPLVSVVIPVYNVEAYLPRCLDSVIGQTCRDLEILLIDDGSTDGCPAICDAYAEKDGRIKVIHKQNAGLGMARNTGIEAAAGRYICFFDSDDYVDATLLEKGTARAEATGADIVLYGYFTVDEAGRTKPCPVSVPKPVFRDGEAAGELLPALYTYEFGLGISAWSKLFSLSLFRETGLRFRSERETVSEDAFFLLECFSRVRTAAVVPEPLYGYAVRGTSLSRSYRPDRQEKNNAFLASCLTYCRENGLPEAVAVGLTVRYHAFTVATLKQIRAAALPKAEKRKALRAVFEDPFLHTTLGETVLAKEKRTLRLFYTLIRRRRYRAAALLLRLKTS